MNAMAEIDEIVEALRRAGARFGFVFGSGAEGRSRPDSDIDVAAY
jgi:predicted nucleotidyltransferase